MSISSRSSSARGTTPGARLAASAMFAVLLVGPVLAQARPAAPARATVPAGWVVRPDADAMGHGDGATVSFVAMQPGWHVTTGPAAILYDSTRRATGNWRLEAVIHLFDPGARAEGFGVFFGGANLASPTQRYAYALVRRDGRALLKVREGETTRTVREWAANAAIPQWKPGPKGASVRYPLVVEARGDRVTVLVNNVSVLDAPRRELPTDGIVGLRINHALNVHVETLTVTPLAAR
ncbi:MAG: hypothetical protein MUF21_08325 [Gemmatimonadaceae bacterium]|nr:hypothetical protein [Gemmatimonadaceae bacterium]